jgi:hypothetical protein
LHVNLKAHQIHVFQNFPIDLPLSVLFSFPSEIKWYVSAAAKKSIYLSVELKHKQSWTIKYLMKHYSTTP